MLVSTAIQAHPARQDIAEALQATIPGSEVVYDPEPHDGRNPWRTYREALSTTPAAATHRMVIQDDSVPCAHLAEALPSVVAPWPDALIVLFVAYLPHNTRMAMMRACDQGHRYAVCPIDLWIPAVAVVWPVALIEPTLDWVEAQRYPKGFTADDEIIGRARTALEFDAVATVPSLVEHPDDVESIAGIWQPSFGRNENRVAWCPIDSDLDLRDLDWR